jgi:hypothetical protein
MTVGSKLLSAFDGDIPVTATGKEVLTGSASGSEIDVQKSGKGPREATTFVAHGLRKNNYKPVDTYEGLHRYDPDFEWEPAEERKVVRKVRAHQHARVGEPS